MSSRRLQELSRFVERLHLQALKRFCEKNRHVVLIEFVCGNRRNGGSISLLAFFIDASSHLYKSPCPSIRPLVRPLVRSAFVKFGEKLPFKD